MIFQVYNGISEIPEAILTQEELKFKPYLKELLFTFPIHRIRVRKNYSNNKYNIGIDIELDSTLSSELIYNKIANRIFKKLNIDIVTLENYNRRSNFSYFFYGEADILDYNCSFFIDSPKKPYSKKEFN
jgi:hypothetical protein